MFTNKPGVIFQALSISDVSAPQANWSLLGGVPEVQPG
jgi:hypothetical protein